jgi:uncharacterized membrane protein (UPF0127 family)
MRTNHTKPVRIWNQTRPGVLGERIELAATFWTRARGLLGRPPLVPGEGLLLIPSRGVHMMGMRSPLDVVLADPHWRVVAVYPNLQPWKRTEMHWEAVFALEIPAGVLERVPTRVGDALGCTGPLPGDWDGWITAPWAGDGHGDGYGDGHGRWGKAPPG